MRQKTVTPLRHSFYEPWILGVVAQGFAHPVDRFVEAAFEIDDDAAGPKAPLEFVPRYDFARVFDQRYQRLKRLLLQLNPATLLAQFA